MSCSAALNQTLPGKLTQLSNEVRALPADSQQYTISPQPILKACIPGSLMPLNVRELIISKQAAQSAGMLVNLLSRHDAFSLDMVRPTLNRRQRAVQWLVILQHSTQALYGAGSHLEAVSLDCTQEGGEPNLPLQVQAGFATPND